MLRTPRCPPQIQGECWSSMAALNLNGWMAAIREHQQESEEEEEYIESETDTEEDEGEEGNLGGLALL